jgi:hypothetical protein
VVGGFSSAFSDFLTIFFFIFSLSFGHFFSADELSFSSAEGRFE